MDEPDNYWIDQIITFTTGTVIHQSARIIGFTTASNTITMSPALSAAPSFNDSFVIWGFSGININTSGRYLSSTADGQVGINLDNANGSLSDANIDEIGVRVDAMAADVITAAVIATDAIGSSEIANNAIGQSELQTGAIGSAQFAASAVDLFWEYDSANVSGAQAMGTMLKDTSAYQGGGASLDSGIVSRIMHRVGWGTPRGSGSDSSTIVERDATAAGSITQAEMAEIGDTVKAKIWGAPVDSAYDAGTMGDSAKLWAQTIDHPGQSDTIGYTAFDTVGSGNPIEGVQIDVFTDLSQPRITSGVTDVNGHISWSLRTGNTYYFLGYNPFLYFWHMLNKASH